MRKASRTTKLLATSEAQKSKKSKQAGKGKVQSHPYDAAATNDHTNGSLVEDVGLSLQQHSAGPGLGTGMCPTMHAPVPGLQSGAHPLPAPHNLSFTSIASVPQKQWTNTTEDRNATSASEWPPVPSIPLGPAAPVVDYDPLLHSYFSGDHGHGYEVGTGGGMNLIQMPFFEGQLRR